MAGVAQSHIPFRFAWQAWRNLTSAVLLHGRRRATHGKAWHTYTFVLQGSRGTISHPPSFCVARVPLMGLGGPLGASFVADDAGPLPGRRGAFSHPRSFCMAGVAQSNIRCRFFLAGLAQSQICLFLRTRRATHGLGGALGPVWSPKTPRDIAAGLAQSHIHLRFPWQAWRNLTSAFVFSWQVWDSWDWVARLGRFDCG